MNINMNFDKYNRDNNKKYRGFGMVSGNNSSRLLIDYKSEHPRQYKEILTRLFGVQYLGINHLKLEMGSDVNSSSGTEPAIKRFETEKADVTRGAGYILAADAKKINPDLTLDMLFWSDPAWVTKSKDVYDARYRWYRDTLTAAYTTFGLMFDYISVSRNERAIDTEWIKYISMRMKKETECPYDFSKVKIVAADEDNSWKIADMMMTDEELCNAIDVIGTHYTSQSSDNAKLLAAQKGKDLWFSEGSAPMCYSYGTSRFDGSGLTGINGILDIANRIVAMYACGRMTMYEFQPAVAAYYDGVTFCHKELILANQPWSGHYSMNCGYYMALHFSRFIHKGWCFLDDACACDGETGGDGHALINTKYSYLTAINPDTKDFSQIIVNSTDKPIEYTFDIENANLNGRKLYLWKTTDAKDVMKKDYLSMSGIIIPDNDQYSITVSEHSLVTITSLSEFFDSTMEETADDILALPYIDDFQYTEYNEKYLEKRGFAPRYTTDQGGAFEIDRRSDKNVLMQMITPDIKPEEWGKTPDPVTCFGDDRWFNYELESKINFSKSDNPDTNYIGIGVRYILGAIGQSGYSLILTQSCKWKCMINDKIILEGQLDRPVFDATMKLSIFNNVLEGYIDNKKLFTLKMDNQAIAGAGRCALYSSYNHNSFEYVKVLPNGINPYITRIDDTDYTFDYTGEWKHELMSGFTNFKRTLSKGKENAKCSIKYNGTGIAVFGINEEECVLEIEQDGRKIESSYMRPLTGSREIFYMLTDQNTGSHEITLRVISGTLSIDGALIMEA